MPLIFPERFVRLASHFRALMSAPRLALLSALAVLSLGWAGAAQASVSGVVISQIYGGNGSVYARDYVELFNGGSAPVSIDGWSVQYAAATGTGPFANGVTVLTGVLQPGQYHLVGLASSTTGAALPTPDSSGSTNLSGTAGKVALVNAATGLACNGGSTPCSPAQLAQIVDLVGYGNANFFEGAAAPAATASNAVLRNGAGCADSDNNSADLVIGTPAPRNRAVTPVPCGSGNAPVVAQCPAQVALASGTGATLALRASDADGTVTSATFGGGQAAGMSLVGFVPSPATGSPAQVDLQLATSVANGSYSVAVDFSNGTQTGRCTIAVTVAPPAASFTPIAAIQGSGATSPVSGTVVTTRGVVTRVNNNGYYLQDPVGDGNPLTSEGLFVFTAAAPTVVAGQWLEVRGTVSEFNTGSAANPLTASHTVTELINATTLLLGIATVSPTPIAFPEGTPDELERYEGMLVRIDTPLVASQNFFQGRYGQVTLGAPGRLYKPTQLHRPGSAAALALTALNARASLVLDDGSTTQNPNPIPYIGADNTLRAGDTLSSLTGVIDYGLATNSADGLADWRLHPTVTPVFTRAQARSATPPAVPGNLKVATFNVLNYFTTFTDGRTAFGQTGQGCAPSGTTGDCRGADNATEFARQSAKIVAALAAIDADVVGLMEIQNNGDTALQHLVDQLNAVLGAGHYAITPAPANTGTDAIRVAMIHRPARVTLEGPAQSDGDPIHNRPPMAQTFRLVENGERFSVVVTHFKSKSCTGAAGADLDAGDGQGCFNARRTAQSQRLLTFISQLQTQAGDTDVLALGDFNAYGQEDPVFTLTSAGLVDEARRTDALSYSFVFDGEAGALDHVFASASLSPRVGSARHWHINADEPSVIDYNTEFKPQDFYAPTPYRSSDHDPVLIGITLQPGQAQTISLPPIDTRGLAEGSFVIGATASSGLTVSLQSQTPAVCTVNGNQVTLIALGTCTIEASQSGNGIWSAAPPVLLSFTVLPGLGAAEGDVPLPLWAWALLAAGLAAAQRRRPRSRVPSAGV